MAVGKGTEDVSLYQNAELLFCNIDNIHVMRASANCLADALAAQSSPHSNLKEALQSANVNDGSGLGYHAKIEESGWLRHVRLVLMASVFAAEKLHFEAASVLIHCSDGWYDVACALLVSYQCTALQGPHCADVQPGADSVGSLFPHAGGDCGAGGEGVVLIRPQISRFVAGHAQNFVTHVFSSDRCGHGYDQLGMPDERSPVFLQFLDALHQVMLQFPSAFEYSASLLLFLADHVHSCLFGNFLGNCDRERCQELQVKELTRSVWAYVLDHRSMFLRKEGCFAPYLQPIWPVTNQSRILLWTRYWQRWDLGAHPNSLNEEQWHDDWGSGLETDPQYRRSSYTYVARPKREFTTSWPGPSETSTDVAPVSVPPMKPRKVSITSPVGAPAQSYEMPHDNSDTITSDSLYFTAMSATGLDGGSVLENERQSTKEDFELVDRHQEFSALSPPPEADSQNITTPPPRPARRSVAEATK